MTATTPPTPDTAPADCGQADQVRTSFASRLDDQATQRVIESATYGGADRRMHPRVTVDLPAVALPFFANHHPGEQITGRVVDVGVAGMGVVLDSSEHLSSQFAIVGVRLGEGGDTYYSTVQVRSAQLIEQGLRIGCQFISGCADPFDPANLVPRVNPQTLRLQPAMDRKVLGAWIARGVLIPEPLDRVKSCPKCFALPTFRDGCLECGSPNIKFTPLIHHFACAHVARADEFEQQGMLACPKCRAKNLIVGSDFEHLAGPTQCHDCNWKAAAPAMIGECLLCGLRFPGSEAVEEEVSQFYVRRMDPLALINEAR